LFGNIFDTGGGSHVVQTPIAVMTSGQFQHVALTYDKTSGLTSIYHNGTLITSANIGSFTPRTSSNFYLGYRPGSVVFNGEMDEPAVYDHALSGSEVRSIFTAGIAGKLKSSSTPAGLFRRVAGRSLAPETVSSTVGDVTVTFQNVTSAGTTQEISMDHSILPPLPSGLPLLTYDVATSASYTGNVDLCFNVPGLAGVPIANLRVYHLESGVWVNRTASGATHSALCTTGVTSLSPFAIANVTPSAANVSISGRVLTPGGRGIVNALVRLTDSHGMTRIVQTGSLGYYSFEGVAAGQNYSLSVSARRYRFGEPVRIVFPGDEITDADFIAME
jgi:hypothetical protein